jgi:hypothetical protein
VGDWPITQRVLCKKDFGWISLWGLNPEMLWSLWLMASATWGEITSAEGLHDWRRRAVPLLNYTLTFALQLTKSMENLSHDSRVVRHYSLRRLGLFLKAASACLLNISPPRLTVGDFNQPLVGTSAFQVAEPSGSPHQLSLSRNSRSLLWCGRRRMESPYPCEFACY